MEKRRLEHDLLVQEILMMHIMVYKLNALENL